MSDTATITQAASPEVAAVDTPKVDAPKQETQDNFSERAQALLRKERQAYKIRDEAKALKAQAEADKAEAAKLRQEYYDWKAKLEEVKKGNKLKALELAGTDYNELTQYYLNQGAPTPELMVQGVQKEIEQLRKENEMREQALRKEQEAQAAREYEEILGQFKQEVGDFVKAKSDTYELINLLDESQLVYDTIEEYFNTNKKVLSVKEAADLVESYLEDQVKKATATKKFQQLSKQTKEAQSQQKPVTQSRTLSNDMTSSAPSFLPAKTEQERMQRAMAALDK